MRRCKVCRAPINAARSDAVYCGGPCRAEASRLRHDPSAQSRARRVSHGHSGPSGCQISYRKLLVALADYLNSDHEAELFLTGLLPERQRQRL